MCASVSVAVFPACPLAVVVLLVHAALGLHRNTHFINWFLSIASHFFTPPHTHTAMKERKESVLMRWSVNWVWTEDWKWESVRQRMTEREVEFTKKINKIQGLEDTESSSEGDWILWWKEMIRLEVEKWVMERKRVKEKRRKRRKS